MSECDVISEGQFVVIQRLDYLRTHKIGKEARGGRQEGGRPKVKLGKETVFLSGALGSPFGSTFRMVRKDKCGPWELEKVAKDAASFQEDRFLQTEGPETDNRDLLDQNSSQKLSKDEIESLKEEGKIGDQMISTLVENSESFQKKTKFSQAKFLKKKADKYFEYLVLRRPSIRLLMDIQYKADPTRIMNLRVDSLAQILNQVNVRSGGRYLVYETGCQGLVVASVLERVGADESGKVIHVFQTGNPQTQALGAMNFPEDVTRNLLTLNMYHLRSLEQGHDIAQMHNQPSCVPEENKEKDGDTSNGSGSQEKRDEPVEDKEAEVAAENEADNCERTVKACPAEDNSERAPEEKEQNDPKPKIPHRQYLREQSLKSFELMSDRTMDGVIVACRQHPTAILLHLLPYLAPSRPWAVFSPYKEPLMDAYLKVKETGRCVAVNLSESWLRGHQVLEGRTHPTVTMSGGGGYVLTGIYVDNTEVRVDASDEDRIGLNADANKRRGGRQNKRFRRR